MSAITIAMPRMVPNQLLAEAHAKYPESLARAGAEMRWIELDDPEKAVQDALACDGLLLPGGIYHFLLDPLQAAGELADGTLTLHLNKAPAYPMFNKPEIAEKFRLAVQTLTGQNVRVVMQPMDTATQIKQRQIEELTRFPNVTIR